MDITDITHITDITADIAALEPEAVGGAEFAGYFEVFTAASKVDRPDALLPGPEAFLRQLRNPHPSLGEQRIWQARVDGRTVGAAIAHLAPEPNVKLALLSVMTHPTRRGQGIGTVMLRHVLPHLADAGRGVIAGHGVTVGGAGERWALRTGFRETQRLVMSALELGAEPSRSPAEYAVPGYRVRSWRGAAPADVLESYARARNAILDAPAGSATLEQEAWTADSVRAEEDALAAAGVVAYVAVAIEESTSEVRAVTMIHQLPGQPGVARQLDTAVHPGHRRRGLALWVKATVAGKVRNEQPSLRVLTNVDASNAGMLAVNGRIGFVPVRSMLSVEAAVGDLRAQWETL